MKTESKSPKNTSDGTEGTGVEDVTPRQLHEWLGNDEALLIDVREPMEHARESIPGSERMDTEDLASDEAVLSTEKRLVVHCNTGNRSSQACRMLAGQYPGTIHNLEGGIQAWKEAGYETNFNEEAPIGIQRQVQITAGSLVLAGTIGGLTISPWFYAVPLFVGSGLLYAGLSGTCGMALLLSRMPWNQVEHSRIG